MARETKVGLLIGLGVILLVGIIISDHLAVSAPQDAEARATAAMTGFADQAQEGIHPGPAPTAADPRDRSAATPEAGHGKAPATAPSGTPRLIDQERFAEPELAEPDQRVPETQSARRGPALADLPAPPTAWRALDISPDNDPLNKPESFENTPAGGTVSAAGPPLEDAQNNPSGIALDPGDLPAAGPAQPVAPVQRQEGAELIHYVEAGDTLPALAARYYNDSAYQASIAQANRGALNPDGSLIPGTRLLIPNRAGHIPPQAAPATAGAPGEPTLMATGLFEPAVGVAAPGEAPRTVRSVADMTESRERTVEVQPGDSLSKLAERHLGSQSKYLELYEANKDQLESPDRVVVGMKLRLPAATASLAAATPTAGEAASGAGTTTTAAADPAPPARAAVKTYTVQTGDNLSAIAEKALGDRNRWREIFEANQDRLDSPDRVKVGQELRLPS